MSGQTENHDGEGAPAAWRDATRVVLGGRRPQAQYGVVNPAVYHASTILSPSLDALERARRARPGDAVTDGRHGTPGTYAFEDAIALLEGGYRTRLCQSGPTAVAAPLLAYLSAGDHLLMCDSVCGPTRAFCDGMLARLGVETTYFDPLVGGDIAALIRPNTAVVFVESPGSLTFEVPDVPAIAAAADDAGIWTMMDNSWASPLGFRPFEHGVDIAIQAVTTYISGHADLVMGAVTVSRTAYPALQRGWSELGLGAGPDDVYLAMRGMRTLATRMERHQANGLRVAEWLARQPEVLDVLHPALPGDPGHALWKRDFRGASSLFGFIIDPRFANRRALAAMLDGMELFGMGASWGGYESLLVPVDPGALRAATRWPREGRPDGQVMRIHVGLEDPLDLIDDLSAGFARMRAAR